MSSEVRAVVPETVMPEVIRLTDKAADRVLEILQDEINLDMRLRVYITGGGCSGFQYGFILDDKYAEDDTLIEKRGIAMVVDSLSYQYLVGAEVDYEFGLNGARFLVKNPNAKSTCGCGASFTI